MPVAVERKKSLIEQFRLHEGDTGSPEAQIPRPSERLKAPAGPFKLHPKDPPPRRGRGVGWGGGGFWPWGEPVSPSWSRNCSMRLFFLSTATGMRTLLRGPRPQSPNPGARAPNEWVPKTFVLPMNYAI